MIDAMMAICITAIGVLSLLSFMPQGWSSSRSSDSRGRAAMIMHREFENMQALIENKCNPTPTAATPYTKTVNSSGQGTAITGDQSFTVNKTITPVAGKNNAWTVTVQVIWPGTTTGVRDSHQIVQQDDYAFPVVAGTTNCSSNPTVSFN